MNNFRYLLTALIALALLGFGARIVSSQANSGAPNTVQVHMVITDEAVRDDSEIPILRPENVQVNQGKTSLKVDHHVGIADHVAAVMERRQTFDSGLEDRKTHGSSIGCGPGLQVRAGFGADSANIFGGLWGDICSDGIQSCGTKLRTAASPGSRSAAGSSSAPCSPRSSSCYEAGGACMRPESSAATRRRPVLARCRCSGTGS